jgi:hypothetical protein
MGTIGTMALRCEGAGCDECQGGGGEEGKEEDWDMEEINALDEQPPSLKRQLSYRFVDTSDLEDRKNALRQMACQQLDVSMPEAGHLHARACVLCCGGALIALWCPRRLHFACLFLEPRKSICRLVGC